MSRLLHFLYAYRFFHPTAGASAVWPSEQDWVHYTYTFTEAYTIEDSTPNAKSAASAGWAAVFA